MAIDAHYGP